MIFFGNPKVTSKKLIEQHYIKTAERVKECKAKYILAIQDQTYLNYTNHKAKIDLGRIGKSKSTNQYGLIQHNTLCVTDYNEPLGLIDLQFFHNDEFDTSIHHSHRPIEEKESYVWIKSLEAMSERLGDSDKKIITVADREGDFFEFLHALSSNNRSFVIRSLHNRYTGENHRARGEKIRDLLKDSPDIGSMIIDIQDVNSREIKEIKLSLKAISVRLPAPNKSAKEKKGKEGFSAISVNVVQAYNGEQEWILITNLPIDHFKKVEDILNIYRCRWHIEDFHKVLKTGYQVDEIYLHKDRQTIENLLTVASISACRLYWIIYIGRGGENILANDIFEEFEWKAVYVYFKEKIPEITPTLSEVILRIARLGGYKPTKKQIQPPGIKTMWIGFQNFTIAAQMYKNMSTKT